ncbi:MAG: hypothetical protein QOC81_2964 [Thermoanaerobaculia bacterium]|jgi:hypothetical protein|nr:hypothetical protein [Thermoanaerobaculia bacterium]
MRKLKVLLLLAVLLFPLAATAQRRHGARVKVINQSKWEIHHLYLSPKDSNDWGPDQLGEDVLATGHSITLTNIRCNHYDIRVVDEDGDECVIEDVSLCRDESFWKITNKALLDCENAE